MVKRSEPSLIGRQWESPGSGNQVAVPRVAHGEACKPLV